MKKILAVIMVIMLLLISYSMGCTDDDDEEKDDTTKNLETGAFVLLVSDAPADIADFDSLMVTFSHARVFTTANNDSGEGFSEIPLNGSQADLTLLVGPDALPIINTSLEVGNYSKIELFAESVHGVLLDGTNASVKIPSEKLKITKSFEVKANETTNFVFDINVVKKGQGDEYNLLPVISESGVIGKDLKGDQVKVVTKEEKEKEREEREKEKEEKEKENEKEDNDKNETRGNFELLISDAPANISDFSSLIVTFSQARVFPEGNNSTEENFSQIPLNGTQVDLTLLVGPNATSIANISLAAGNYTKIELHVTNATGVVNGSNVSVKVPSNKLQITMPFEVKANETLKFVFDINVVKKGHKDDYNLLPVISESGVVGKDIPEDQLKLVPKKDKENEDEEEKEEEEENEEEENEDNNGTRGDFELLISDAPANISDFSSLLVTFSYARIFAQGENGSEGNYTILQLNETSVNLTLLVGPNATSIANISLAVGNYSKIELYVANVTGIVNGTIVDVKVPSNKLQITMPFQVKANETIKFVFDINVVKKGQKDEYNLLPVISESGVVGKDLNEEDVEEI